MSYGDPAVKQVVKAEIPPCSRCSGRFMAGVVRVKGRLLCWFCAHPRPEYK